jgi:GntR family transcriptional regulator
MVITIDPDSGIPVYRQIMDQIRFQIASGMLEPDDELPSTRSLSTELSINPMTISKAYSLLEKEGMVQRRPGRPLVVAPRSEQETMLEKRRQLEEALLPTAWIAQQLDITPKEALDIFQTVLERVYQDQSRSTE